MRTRPALNRSSLPRSAAAIIAATLLVLVPVSCDDTGGAAAPDLSVPTTTSGPALTLDRPAHDFGAISDVRPHTTTFTYTNTGTEPLVISNVKRGCGCTSVSLSSYNLAPGARGTMQVVFDPKRKVGRQEKTVTLVTNAMPQGVIEIGINATVQPLLTFVPGQIRFDMLQLGREHKTTTRLYYSDPDMEFRSVSTTNPFVSARLLESGLPSEGAGPGSYMGTVELTVSADADWGVLFAAQLVVTAYGRPAPDLDPVEHTAQIFITGTLFGELMASPRVISMGQSSPGQPFRGSFQLRRSSGAPFQVLGASIAESTVPQAQVDVRPIAPHVYEVTVYGTPLPQFTGGVTGWVNIRTDVEGEESLNMRFSGLVR